MPFVTIYRAAAAVAVIWRSVKRTAPENDASSIVFAPGVRATCSPFDRASRLMSGPRSRKITFPAKRALVSPFPASPVPSSVCARMVLANASGSAGMVSSTFSLAVKAVGEEPSGPSAISTRFEVIRRPAWPLAPANWIAASPATRTCWSVCPSGRYVRSISRPDSASSPPAPVFAPVIREFPRSSRASSRSSSVLRRALPTSASVVSVPRTAFIPRSNRMTWSMRLSAAVPAVTTRPPAPVASGDIRTTTLIEKGHQIGGLVVGQAERRSAEASAGERDRPGRIDQPPVFRVGRTLRADDETVRDRQPHIADERQIRFVMTRRRPAWRRS